MTFSVYFAQHGLAVDKAEDAKRPLSRAGIEQSKTIARAMQNSKIPITRVFHSGKLRASQTAEIFQQILNISSIAAIDGLSPNDEVTLLAQNLNINHALYIGHLPHLEKLAAYLVTGNENSNIIKFQNSAVLCLEKSENNYQLRWYLTPELL
ncbi:MAG: phosphohistidine phosphatase SixA [Gammaproteobacteria bacterium]